MRGALGHSHPCCAPEGDKVSQQPVLDSGKDCVAFHGVHTHTCKQTCEHIIYKQSEVWTFEVVDMA